MASLVAYSCWQRSAGPLGIGWCKGFQEKAALWQHPILPRKSAPQKLQPILQPYRLPFPPTNRQLQTRPVKQPLGRRERRQAMAAVNFLDSCSALLLPLSLVSPLWASGKLRRFSGLMVSACLQPLEAQHMIRCKIWTTFCGLLPL